MVDSIIPTDPVEVVSTDPTRWAERSLQAARLATAEDSTGDLLELVRRRAGKAAENMKVERVGYTQHNSHR
jgi:hypothetical protein